MMFQLRLTLKPSRDYTSSACRVVDCRIISCKTISIYQNKMLQDDLTGSIELPHNLFLDNKQISLVNCNIRNWSDLYYAHDRMQHTCPSRSKLDHVVWTKQGDFSILASRLASPKRHYSSSLSIKELGTNVPLPILLGLFQHFLRILHLLALSHAILIHPFRASPGVKQGAKERAHHTSSAATMTFSGHHRWLIACTALLAVFVVGANGVDIYLEWNVAIDTTINPTILQQPVRANQSHMLMVSVHENLTSRRWWLCNRL